MNTSVPNGPDFRHPDTGHRYVFQRGFSLVEVFVALLVLSVGLIALAKLQVDLVRGGADSRARATAVAIAEAKAEDLRAYAVRQPTTALSWSATVSPMAWSFIGNNTGGRMPAGTLDRAGVRYKLSWTSADNTFTGADGNTGTYKQVTIIVSWTGANGVAEQVTLATSITDAVPGMVKLAGKPLSDAAGPALIYKPLPRPEVVWTDVGGNVRRETSRPLPTVSKTQNSTLVSFDVVNYKSDTNAVQRREEFLTVSCQCTFDGSGLGRTPASVGLIGTQLGDISGKWVTKTTGKPREKVSQPDVCGVCCRDHHDYSDGSVNYFYSPGASTAHNHYLLDSSGVLSSSPVTSGDYDEVCRLKRVNGIFQVFEDWRLRSVTVLPQTDMADGATKGEEYQNALKKFIDSYAAFKAGKGTEPTTLAFTPSAVSINPGTSQLLARALYIDNMPDTVAKRIKDILEDDSPSNDDTVRALVPFYEVHMTKLADWSTYPDANNALVSSAAVATDTSGVVSGTGIVYSRGFLQPASGAPGGSPAAIASVRNHNAGVTDTLSVDPSYEATHAVTAFTVGKGASVTTYYQSSINPSSETSPSTDQHKDGTLGVTVAASTTKTITVSGTFKQAKGSGPISGTVKVETVTADVKVPCTTGGALDGKGTAAETFTCTVAADASGIWDGTVTFTYPSLYQVCLADNATSEKGKYKSTCTPPSDATATEWRWGLKLSASSTGNTIYVSTTTVSP